MQMTDIEQKALVLVNEIECEEGVIEPTPRIMRALIMDEALCRAIEQHEAFKQKVSFALATFKDGNMHTMHDYLLDPFIIPAPKPDPLVDVLKDFGGFMPDVDDFRAALKARGLEITPCK